MSTALNSASLCTEQQPGRKAQAATRISFFVAGFAMAAWAPLVLFVKHRLDINDASLGMLLLSLGIGSLLAMPFAGLLTSKLGCRTIILTASALLSVILPMLTQADTIPLMAVTLLFFGAAIGMIDVSMNIQAVIVERASGRAMMSGFHGFFSVGGIAGAGGVSALLWLGLSPLMALLVIVALLLVLMSVAQSHLLRAANNTEGGPMFAIPRGWVMFIGVLCFIMFLAEGAILDWSALFLSAERHLSSAQAGIGYAAFSVAMTIGRLSGDRVVNALGRYAILAGGSLCAALGLLLTISIDNALTSILGFVMVGIGASNVVPILFSAAGNQKIMPASLAIASITTVGYAGILVGPTLLGFIAQLSSVSLAFGCVALLLLIVCASARAITRHQEH
ncbi:putative MFS family arabinose efflux permease|uniref:Putative MFS family arabinose efflux permease n=1 Tax=Brenneria salicis ATCC 15712 = DSM 30166 TaxID=714314 RepID=A0A366IBZ4_9GAMM|nr:MFS transporter [Brenneria salicis]NMN92292.1 putative MFS family arabinose efflux permease [Brenneria salicis ATCC 15712 = DSM 30166]RBP67631.1 putative MFS family arabinose efflux permease [Brenneria salicis ATCC 15712 = DSM 30166]RLM32391.1 MFS transporter [Brenneria salicis ATCC 15712 = DSM 30166]